MTSHPTRIVTPALSVLVALLLAACGSEAPGPESSDAAAGLPEPAPNADQPSVYAAALAVPSRLEADYERDKTRRPDEVLEFFGIEPGMVVLDMFSGGGYYSEVIAHVVGAGGHVDAHANEAYLGFVGDEFSARHAEGRLENVDVLMAENNELDLEPERYDVVMMVLSYHDLYYDDPDSGWEKFDVPMLLAELLEGLKPGGTLAIVDHQAEAGAPAETGNTLHRIDAQIVIDELTAAGFELVDRSDILRNPDDDYSKNVFDPAVRGTTDRFVLKFRKPG